MLVKNKCLYNNKITISTGKEILRLPKHTTKRKANNDNTNLILTKVTQDVST